MPITTAFSEHSDAQRAAAEIAATLGAARPKLVLFFASSKRDPAATARAIHAAFPASLTLGCTTAGELTTGRMMTGSVCAMAFGEDDLVAADAAVIEDPANEASRKAGIAQLEKRFGALAALDPTTHVG